MLIQFHYRIDAIVHGTLVFNMTRGRFVTILLIATLASDRLIAQEPNKSTTQPVQTVELVQGQLYDANGGGVQGVTVKLTDAEGENVIGAALTNRYGDFSISAAPPDDTDASLVFECMFYKKVERKVTLNPDSRPPFVDHRMEGDAKLTGRVIDRQKQSPVAGADIQVKYGYQEASAQSQENGAFVIADLLPGMLELTVDADGYARVKKRIDVGSESEPLELQLDPERIVHLRIVDQHGAFIPGVNVEMLDDVRRDYRQLMTGPSPPLTIRGLGMDVSELRLRLTHDGYVSSVKFDRTISLPDDVRESTHELMMQPAGGIVGTVVDADNGESLMGARLSVGTVVSAGGPRAWSKLDGTYVINGVPPGTAVVTCHLSGYAPQLKEMQVAAGQQAQLHLKMGPARTVTGTLVNTNGEPVADGHIMCTQWRGYGTLGLQAMTNARGRFEIIDAPQDAFEVSVYHQDYEPIPAHIVPPDADHIELTLSARKQPIREQPLSTGEQAPDLAVTDLSGQRLTLENLRGRVVVLDFWATWCAPCVQEVPKLVQLHKSHGDHEDLVMISVSLDHDESRLKQFISDRQMEWHHVVGQQAGAQEAASTYGVQGIPAVFVIDRGGKIAAGNVSVEHAGRVVETLLQDAKSAP